MNSFVVKSRILQVTLVILALPQLGGDYQCQAQSACHWSTWTSPQITHSTPVAPGGGVNFKIGVGGTIAFQLEVTDHDLKYNPDTCTLSYPLSVGEPHVKYHIVGPGSILPAADTWVAPDTKVTFTAPLEINKSTAIQVITEDDYLTSFPPEDGISAPDTGNRNDGQGLERTYYVTTSDCPTSITKGSTCNGNGSAPTYGVLVAEMEANPSVVDWDTTAIQETVTYNSKNCSAPLAPGATLQMLEDQCYGDSTFIVGAGHSPAFEGCSMPETQNSFWDVHHWINGYSFLAGSGTCWVKCDQVYKCGTTTVGTFTITKTLTYSNGVTSVAITK